VRAEPAGEQNRISATQRESPVRCFGSAAPQCSASHRLVSGLRRGPDLGFSKNLTPGTGRRRSEAAIPTKTRLNNSARVAGAFFGVDPIDQRRRAKRTGGLRKRSWCRLNKSKPGYESGSRASLPGGAQASRMPTLPRDLSFSGLRRKIQYALGTVPTKALSRGRHSGPPSMGTL
jgi:hypothetical protein